MPPAMPNPTHPERAYTRWIFSAWLAGPGCFFHPQGSSVDGGSRASETSTTDPGVSSLTVSASGPGATSGSPVDPPEAVAMQMSFSQVKRFGFGWTAAPEVTYYQLRERLPEQADYAQIGTDIVGTSVSHMMPLHFRRGASYVLRACNDGGCANSEEVGIADSMAAAIGYFKASNSDAYDLFGGGIALSADGSTLVVGAPGEASASIGINGDEADNSIDDAGAVYVLTRVDGTWKQQAYLKASNPDVYDYFGGRVSLSADGNTLAVGAFGEDGAATGINGDANDSATDTGAVYMFIRTGETWSQQAYVKASNTGSGDRFGISVALSGDGDTLAVGAEGEASLSGNPGEDSAGGAGAVYVFGREVGVWSQRAYLKAPKPAEGQAFGFNVALSADGSTLAVGTPGDANTATGINSEPLEGTAKNAGAVHVFARSGSGWGPQAYIKASNTGAEDYFGCSVALSGDGSILAVGARNEDSAAVGVGGDQGDTSDDTGAVYVFARLNGDWAQEAYIKASNTQQKDLFGVSVALSDDGDTLAVGAPQEGSAAVGVGGDQADESAPLAGAVYVFTRASEIWLQRAYVKAPNTGPDDRFGSMVTLSADALTLGAAASGEDSAAVGVSGNQADETAKSAGAVYLY